MEAQSISSLSENMWVHRTNFYQQWNNWNMTWSNQFPTWLLNWFIQSFNKGHEVISYLFILGKCLWFELGLKYISESDFQIDINLFLSEKYSPLSIFMLQDCRK